jgi:hypothetical protein
LTAFSVHGRRVARKTNLAIDGKNAEQMLLAERARGTDFSVATAREAQARYSGVGDTCVGSAHPSVWLGQLNPGAERPRTALVVG